LTALTANYDAERKDGILVSYKVAAATTIYKGALVCLNASGYAVPAQDATGLVFIGVAYEKALNATGANGDVAVRVWKDGSFRVAKAGAAAADLGAAAYAVDDNTVALTSSHNVAAGTIVEILGTDAVRVLIRNACN
jgi:hypothetical protein